MKSIKMHLARLIFTLHFIFQTALFSNAQDTLDVNIVVTDPSTALSAKWRDQYKNFKVIQLESALLARQAASGAFTAFRIDVGEGMRWILELQPANLAASSYELVALTPEGEYKLASHPDYLYKGKVNGSGAVRLAIKEGFIYGSLWVGDQEFFIEPLDRFSGSKEKEAFLIYQRREAIAGPSISCGYEKTAPVAKVKKDMPSGDMALLGGGDCFQLPFVPIADYSIYQKFGNDIQAVEAAMLATLNLAEGAFTTLNLGADGSTDLGEDELQFAVQKIYVATCASCDLVSNTEDASGIGSQLTKWIEDAGRPGAHLFQFWTTRQLYQPQGNGIVGTYFGGWNCEGPGTEILRYASDDPAFLRVLVAHETGHVLGCPHDNDVKGSVRNFIMFSSAGGGHTRFSSLADFGGGAYSSHLRMRETLQERKTCLQTCGASQCAPVKDLQVRYFDSPDSVQMSWSGIGNFRIRYKARAATDFDPDHVQTLVQNRVTLKGLQPCEAYSFEIEQLCSNGEKSQATTIIVAPSSLAVSAIPVNSRGDRHDLQLAVECHNCGAEPYTVSINKKQYEVNTLNNSGKLLIRDLFSDGAVHRIIVQKKSGVVCNAITSYKAPYYRANSTRIAGADFNACNIPDGWKDTLVAKAVATSPDARWYVEEKNDYSSRSPRGNFDSTCMLFYSRLTTTSVYSGAMSLTSPTVDLRPYKDVKLHFDYNFMAYKFPNNSIHASMTVEVFDGVTWVEVFKKEASDPWPRSTAEIRQIWDSIPSRVFIDLERYKNKDFRLRFIADDGSIAANRSLHLFVALDNIRIDGYVEGANAGGVDFILFPNPSSDVVYIQLNPVPVGEIKFRLLDGIGRLLDEGTLEDYKVSLRNYSAGMYMLQLFIDGKPVGTRKIQKTTR